MYNSFKRQNRDDYISYISPLNAFKNNIDQKGLTWQQNSRNISTSKTQQRYKPERMADYQMERTLQRPPGTTASEQIGSEGFAGRLKSLTIHSSYEDGLIPAAIRAISRGSVNRRTLNANMGRSYYEKFIRTDENARLKHFINEGKDPLGRGFIPMTVKDIDNPLKVLGQQKKALSTTQPRPRFTQESGSVSPKRQTTANVKLHARYNRNPQITQSTVSDDQVGPSFPEEKHSQFIDSKHRPKIPMRSKISDIMKIKNMMGQQNQQPHGIDQYEDPVKNMSDSKSHNNQVGFMVVETTSNSDHTKASGNRLPQVRKTTKQQKAGKNKSYEADQVILEEDYEQRIMNAMRNFRPWKNNADETLKDQQAAQFKHICESNSEAHEVNMKIENLKLQKSGLKRYLESKYEKRLAQKIIVLFDWAQKQIKHDIFFRNITEMLLKPSEDYSEHLRTLKMFTFNLYDMNNDQQICETDLFSLLRCQQDERNIKDGQIRESFFRDVLYRDLMDIQAFLKVRQEDMQMHHPIYHIKPGQNTRIKNLDCFLGVAKIKRDVAQMRRENKETFTQVFREQPVIDNSHLIRNVLQQTNRFHTADGDGKRGANKPWNFEKKQAGLDQSKISQKVSVFIQKMTQEGEGVKPNDRRNSVGLVIQQTDKIYGTKDFNAKISFEEFESKVKFTYGVPLVILDILDTLLGSNFLKDHYAQVFPKKLVERFNPQDDAFLEAKAMIDEDFVPNTWGIFNALGEVDFNVEQPSLLQEERETRQYITLDSCKRNLWKVMGIRNDFFAQMLYGYLSERAAPGFSVNYFQFLKRLMPLWPKKFETRQETEREHELRLKREAAERRFAIHRLIFDLCCLQGKDDITLVDLMQLCVYFREEDPFGKEVNRLLKLLIDRNVRPRFVRSEFKLIYKNYIELVPQQALQNDLVFAFVDHMIKFEHKESKEQLNARKEDRTRLIVIQMPLSDWKATAIQDETGKDAEYFENLKRLEREYNIDETLGLHKDLRVK